MTNKEIKQCREEIRSILSKVTEGNLESLKEATSKLASTAKKVGARGNLGMAALTNLSTLIGSENTAEYGVRVDVMNAHITEILYNINDALRTETMINHARTVNKSWIVSIIALVMALLSAVAAWIAAMRD